MQRVCYHLFTVNYIIEYFGGTLRNLNIGVKIHLTVDTVKSATRSLMTAVIKHCV